MIAGGVTLAAGLGLTGVAAFSGVHDLLAGCIAPHFVICGAEGLPRLLSAERIDDRQRVCRAGGC